MSSRVLLVRHGDTPSTKGDRFTGSVDIPLSPEGRIHASELATRLARYPINAIYSSGLQRAIGTATFIAQVHGLEVTPIREFNEVDHGSWNGHTRAEVTEFDPQGVVEYDRDPFNFKPQGGESGQDVVNRAVPAMQQLVRAHPDQHIVVVAHKSTNRLMIAYFLNLELRRFRDKLGQRPACLNVLQFYSDTEAQLLLLNDISHYQMVAEPDWPYAV
jgi:broad specificity phosphatase PhoE